MKRILIAAAIAAMSAAVSARTFELRVWRGETTGAVVPDFVEFGDVPEGIGIKFGMLRSVKYAPAPKSTQRLECMDRVEWERKPSWLEKC